MLVAIVRWDQQFHEQCEGGPIQNKINGVLGHLLHIYID